MMSHNRSAAALLDTFVAVSIRRTSRCFSSLASVRENAQAPLAIGLIVEALLTSASLNTNHSVARAEPNRSAQAFISRQHAVSLSTAAPGVGSRSRTWTSIAGTGSKKSSVREDVEDTPRLRKNHWSFYQFRTRLWMDDDALQLDVDAMAGALRDPSVTALAASATIRNAPAVATVH